MRKIICKKGKINKLVSLLLIIVLTVTMLTGCEQNQSKAKVQKSFDKYTETLFKDALIEDALSVNFLITEPENYGLENATVDLSFGTKEEYEEDYKEAQEELDYIKKTFSYEKLSKEQQLTYDVLVDSFNRTLAFKDFYYYSTPLGSYLGTNANLPIELSELRFDTEKDIENYLEVLTKTKGYFESLIEFQNEKLENGTLEPDFVLEGIIEQCENYINSTEENFLIPIMNDKIDATSFLDEAKKAEYKEKNEKLINDDFIGAYQYLSDEVAKLVGKGENQKSIFYLPNGKEYYEAIFARNTGTDVTVKEAKKNLEKYQDQLIEELTGIVQANASVVTDVSTLQMTNKDIEDIVKDFSQLIKTDFPEIPTTNFEIKNVHESLQENMSPAMYFISPLDSNDTTERITINPLRIDNKNYMFTTLAHEGYPGHLYQHVYTKNTDIPEIRHILSYNGYADGWATYVETFVMKYAEGNEDVLAYNDSFDNLVNATLCIADIGINYEGWDVSQLSTYFAQYFSGVDAQAVYEQLVEVPSNQAQYTYGFYEIQKLREKAEDELGDKFTDVAFHKAILDPGPAPFSIISKSVETYITSEKDKK
jgi:uncharacterized protein (DUF885 family)